MGSKAATGLASAWGDLYPPDASRIQARLAETKAIASNLAVSS